MQAYKEKRLFLLEHGQALLTGYPFIKGTRLALDPTYM